MFSKAADDSNVYERTLQELKQRHHSRCLFQCHPPIDNLLFSFSSDGALQAEFVCSDKHQGYDNMVHGGIIAAIIDASMAQCCLGHGIVAYTRDLSIRYRTPLEIAIPTRLDTRIVKEIRGVLFSLECRLTQYGNVHVEAKGRFFKPQRQMPLNRTRH